MAKKLILVCGESLHPSEKDIILAVKKACEEASEHSIQPVVVMLSDLHDTQFFHLIKGAVGGDDAGLTKCLYAHQTRVEDSIQKDINAVTAGLILDDYVLVICKPDERRISVLLHGLGNYFKVEFEKPELPRKGGYLVHTVGYKELEFQSAHS